MWIQKKIIWIRKNYLDPEIFMDLEKLSRSGKIIWSQIIRNGSREWIWIKRIRTGFKRGPVPDRIIGTGNSLSGSGSEK
jgi:hypothetical protein